MGWNMWCCKKCEMRISISKLRVVRALCCAVCYEAWAVILEQMGLIHRYGCHHSHVMKGSMKWYENTTQLKCQSSFDFLWHQTGHANLSHNESFNTSCYYGFMFFLSPSGLVWDNYPTYPITPIHILVQMLESSSNWTKPTVMDSYHLVTI